MGIFNILLKGLGFEGDGEVSVETAKPKKSKKNKTSEYEKLVLNSPVKEEKVKKVENSEVNVNNLVIHAPKQNSDILKIVDCLKRREPLIINLGGLSQREAERILDYLNGAIYAIGGSINRLQGDLFVLCPSGVNLTGF